VLGSGVLNVYPSNNTRIAEMLLERGGVLISEYGLHNTPNKYCFPERNRLVSALSNLVIVVEAGEKSGAGITARLALEQGKEVAAVPGDVFSMVSSGSNAMIRDGAHVITKIDDALSLVFGVNYLKPINKQVEVETVSLSVNQKNIIKKLRIERRLQLDVLCEQLNLEAGDLMAELSELELMGKIAIVGNTVERIIQ